MRKLRGIFRRTIALTLCLGMLLQSTCVQAAGEGDSAYNINSQTVTEGGSAQDAGGAPSSAASVPAVQSGNPDSTAGTEGGSSKETVDFSAVYEGGLIKICSSAQLNAIGTGAAVTSTDNTEGQLGQGTPVTNADGAQITYSPDAQYQLVNDIPLTAGSIWNLPAGFTGSFTSGDGSAVTKDAPLYDSATDTIYVYNSYQLDVIRSDNAANEPVMSNDMIAEEFGMGQLVYPNGTPAEGDEAAAQGYLTYGPEHNYVLAMEFTAERPELKAEAVVYGDGENLDGRQYEGQVIYYDSDGTKYILIGNEQQLRAIGKMDEDGNPYKVTEPVWAQEQEYKGLVGILGEWEDTDKLPYQVYPGDADIGEDETLYGAPDASRSQYPGVGEDTGGAEVTGGTQERHMGSKKVTDPETGKVTYTYDETALTYNTNMERPSGDTTVDIYSSYANYIIFRDISLEGEEWNPLMFSGKMEGRASMVSGSPVTISNINVVPVSDLDSFLGFPVIGNEEKLDTGTNIGIGFFGTITNKVNENDVGLGGDAAVVKNINLDTVTVKNTLTDVADTDSIVSGLTKVLGGLLGVVGGVLDGILGALGGIFGGGAEDVLGDLDLSGLLKELLTIRAAAPDTFATGGFAGRIIGDVDVSGCNVTNLTISNAMNMTGGFVGNVEGLTEYEGLGQALDATVGTLEGILNIIPGLGLGDLITLLLNNENLLEVSNLLPTGYKTAEITDCSVSVKSVENAAEKSFAGGFAGVQTGSVLKNCKVIGLEKVSADKYAGGFAGLTRDAVVDGLLSNLDINIVDIGASSQTTGCSVEGSGLTVTSKSNYAGGFTGAVANSRLSGAAVSGLAKVEADQNYAGGIAGRTTIGYGPALAAEDEVDKGLVGTVTSLLNGVLTGDTGSALLDLVGIKPSELDGCTVSGENIQIHAGNYAGGLFGKGEGTILTGEAVSSVSGLGLVKAEENYAGGLAGDMAVTSAASVISGLAGVGRMLPFTVKNVNINGYVPAETGQSAFQVQAAKYAGGAFGQAAGGTVNAVRITDLSAVSSENYAGGFAGSAGTGSLVDGGGLDILGLELIKVSDLLSVGEAVVLKAEDCSVSGQQGTGFTVKATGVNAGNGTDRFLAGGFVGECASAEISNASVSELKSVTADTQSGYAGGFAASSFTGGLADVTAEPEGGFQNLIDFDGLLQAAGYLIPEYTNCTVGYTADPDDNVQVNAAVAGGFVAEMTGGVLDNSGLAEGAASVTDNQTVVGSYFAGGFAGRVTSGGLAESGGLSLLGGLIKLDPAEKLLSVLEVYIPEIHSASVKASDTGLIVKATASNASNEELSANAGSAGGYLGYGSGAEITDSDLTGLRTTTVTPPDVLDQENGSNYFGEGSSYAVTAPRYAGGYAGRLDIGNAASVGGGLSLLGTSLKVTDLAGALAIVATKITGCDVSGQPQGFSVLANDIDETGVGMAGGYVGRMCGAQINDSDVHSFEYIIGQEAAGGYAGTLEPGDVADVIENVSILNGLITIDNFLSAVQSFVPYIRNSSTDTVPCGGAVRAENGNAGGYAGHSLGGQILGNAEGEGYGSPSEAAACRIRSVYGLDYAGGFTGLMETASTATTGSLELLGQIKVDNPLDVAQGIYPIEENTAVYGPLSHVDYETWNKWVEGVGSNGPFGSQFTGQTVTNQEELDAFLKDYVYGYHVTSPGRDAGDGARKNGSAGGYVGKMQGGVITNGNAHDLQRVTAWRGAGGYAGEMEPGSLASVNELSIGDLDILNTGSVNLLQTFIPVVKTSDVTGYSSGYQVNAYGTNSGDTTYAVGYAGGYVGHMTGGQIWGAQSGSGGEPDRCSASGLRKVNGTAAVGGFAGLTEAGTTLTTDTTSENGLLNQILGLLLDSPELLDVLNDVIPTIKYADVSAWNDYGYTVDGSYTDGGTTTKYAEAAGGFAGMAVATVFGEQKLVDGELVPDGAAGVSAENVRTVIGGKNAGGFIGKTSASGVAEVADGDDKTTLLDKVLGLQGIEILDIFRTYIYCSDVSGSADSGLEVRAMEGRKLYDKQELQFDGNAGGFAGTLLSGDTWECNVTGLRKVEGVNYTGGFAGHMGKTGLVDASGADVLDKLLGLGLGVADVIGCESHDCSVTGVEDGFTVRSRNSSDTKSEIAGGYVGYADLGRMSGDRVDRLKQVASGETAGGFAGRTSHAYLAEVTVDGALLDLVTEVLNAVLKKLLHIDDLENMDLITINVGILKLDLLKEGDLLKLNLLGLPITAALAKDEQVLVVTIGDSEVKLGYDPATEEINDNSGLGNALQVNLIKANRTKAESCTVTGIPAGYDVYGGGAGNGAEEKSTGTTKGYAGGFVGFNDEGLLENNTMLYADVIRGTKDLTGPFSGQSFNESAYPSLDGVKEVEGTGNTYRVYREADEDYSTIKSASGDPLSTGFEKVTQGTPAWNIYTIKHMSEDGVERFAELKDAVLYSGTAGKDDISADVYQEEGAKAKLMLDTATEPTDPSDTPEPPEQQDPCEETIRLNISKVWKDGESPDRPESITLTVHGKPEGAPEGTEEITKTVELTPDNASEENPNIWETILDDLPVYTEIDGQKYYYKYTVTEAKLTDDGYKEPVIEYSKDGYSVTVTNALPWYEQLPDSGGMGTRLLYLAGILLLLGAALSYIRSRSRMAEAPTNGPKRRKHYHRGRRR